MRHISALHLGYSPQEKLQADWWTEALQECYYNSSAQSLLWDKNVAEIDNFADGNIDLTPFLKMFKGKKNITYEPLPMLPIKVQAARSIIENIPIEITVEAMDALAWEKREKDIYFLKNKSKYEEPLQAISDQMNLGKVDLGSTRYTAIPYSTTPYGLDLNEADELQVFVDILSGLSVESALETLLQSMWEFKSCDTIKGQWIKDQLRYGVSTHKTFSSSLTGLPEVEYIHPESVYCEPSNYEDYRDNTYRRITESLTVVELFNRFGEEIGSEDDLRELVSGKGGYCDMNGLVSFTPADYSRERVVVEYLEVKSIDWIGVVPVNKKSKFYKVTTDEKEVKEFNGKKHWAQNTYYAYWLKGTGKFFKRGKLDSTYREQGKEQFQGFSSFVYKSVPKSVVELSIPENKKAQVADIKMQHAIWKAKKSGMFVDLKYIRGAAEALKDDPVYSQTELIRMAFQENDFIGDSEGFDNEKNSGQPPFREIVGGLRNDIVGYMEVIRDASQKISQFTGINDQLTGSAANPEGLVGMQKLLINGATNSISYINRAIKKHCVSLFNSWFWEIKTAIENGGEAKAAITRLIGSKKVNLIDALDDIPLHQMGIRVLVTQREVEREEYRQEVMRLKQLGVISTVDDYILSAVRNPKDKMALLAVRTKQFEKKMLKAREEANEQQQVLLQQQGENQQNAIAAKVEGDKQKIYSQGEVSAKILQLAAQIGLNDKQVEAMLKKNLQQDRGMMQMEKSIKTLETKDQLEKQNPYGAAE